MGKPIQIQSISSFNAIAREQQTAVNPHWQSVARKSSWTNGLVHQQVPKTEVRVRPLIVMLRCTPLHTLCKLFFNLCLLFLLLGLMNLCGACIVGICVYCVRIGVTGFVCYCGQPAYTPTATTTPHAVVCRTAVWFIFQFLISLSGCLPGLWSVHCWCLYIYIARASVSQLLFVIVENLWTLQRQLLSAKCRVKCRVKYSRRSKYERDTFLICVVGTL